METKTQKNIFIIFICSILLIVIIVSGYKAHQIHQERQLRVMNQFIKETARLCYLKGYCEGQITLGRLYELMEIDPIINPETREYLDINMCIDYREDEIIFC